MRRLALFLASCGYVGYVPIAPGTAGSALGVLLHLGLQATASWWLQVGAVLVVSLTGIWASGTVEKQLSTNDPSVVIIDEVAGMLLGLCLLPLSWLGLIVGFVAFRILDIIKPFPCRRAERLSGGAGIMADDLIAGLYTHVFMRVISLWWPGFLVVA